MSPRVTVSTPEGRSMAALRDLTVGWREQVGTSRARAEAAAFTVLVFGGLLLARRGTGQSRGATVALVMLAAGAMVWTRLRESDLWGDPARVILRIAGAVDSDRAARAVRALELVSRDDPQTSTDLAHLHVERSIGALPRDRILGRAGAIGARYGSLTLLLAMGAVGLAATRGFSIFEGADVLFATKHVAPLPVVWLEDGLVEARPPDYLHENERELSAYGSMALPRGTLLTVRGNPTHTGRRLLLTDGRSDVPFVDDGAGRVVARWPLAESAELRIVARFGDVDIREPEATLITSIADELPVVVLEGAPREIRLADVGTSATIPIRYVAADDHGLREVHLVLRSAGKEERRILARLDGETEQNRGGHTLRATDSFIKKSHAPIEIRVEAKDNDPITGPKWGASEAITVIPPEAGEPEALRLDGLRALRDQFVDSLAARMERAFNVPPAARTVLLLADAEGVQADERALETVEKASYAGVGVTTRLAALVRGHMRRVKEAMVGEQRSPGIASHGRLVAATERLVLVVDAVTRGQAQRDARGVARALADVADDLVLATSQLQRIQERDRGEVKADGSVLVLGGGARSLHRLGTLGRDLGEIVDMDLGRVGRARVQEDPLHAEMAASDLAARLKDPDPSFGSEGSSGGRAGGESGGSRGTPGEGDPSDDAQKAFNEAAGELGKLASDHAEELGKVEQALSDPQTESEPHSPSEDEKSHARAVRDATRPLPSVGAGSDSWTNKGAAAREHGEAMARALEEGNAADAVTSGRSALDALDEARQVAARERWTSAFSPLDPGGDRLGADPRLAAARQKLEPEVKWAEEKLQGMRKRAALARAPELAAQGEEEQKLAERAAALHERAEGQGLPQAALEALHQAERAASEGADALKRGDAEQGLAQQREAQRRLEAAETALGDTEESKGANGADNPRSGHADIPNVDAHKGPEEFRRRVLEGLGQRANGRQKDAIRRYADGLLR